MERVVYKACITLSSKLVIKTTINSIRYQIIADFNTMIDNNSWETSPIEIINEDDIGTSIILIPRKVYEGKIELNQFKRNIIRTYYKQFSGKKICLDLSTNQQETITIGEEKTINPDYIRSSTKYKIIYHKPDQEYKKYPLLDNEHPNEDEIEIGTITNIVLNLLLSNYDYLTKKPGIDIFRNKRCLTSENPIGHICDSDGESVYDHLTAGQMRGAKCYIVIEYTQI